MDNHSVVIKIRKVKEGEKIGRWLGRRENFLDKVPADGILLFSDSVNVHPLYIREEDIMAALRKNGEVVEAVSWGDGAETVAYS